MNEQLELPITNGHKPIGPKTLSALAKGNRITPSPMPKGGRQTTDGGWSAGSNLVGKTYSRVDPGAAWRTLDTQRKNFLNLPFQKLLSYGLEISPPLAKAHYDFQRFGNPGRRTENGFGDFARDSTLEFQDQVGRFHGSFPNHCNTMFSSIFAAGALFVELILSDDMREPVDIVIIDPLQAVYQERATQSGGHIRHYTKGRAMEN